MKPVFVAFDTETTGLEPESCEVCEVAGVKFTISPEGAPSIIGQFASLIQIEGSMPPEASRINNIYDSMLVGAPQSKDALQRFFRWVGPSAIMLAHHAAFDMAFLGWAVHKYSLMLPKNPTFCTKRMAIRLVAGRHRLMDLEEALLGKDPWQALKGSGQKHRALYDSQLLAHVFCAMMKLGVPAKTFETTTQTLKALSALDKAKRSFDAPMDSHQLQQEMADMKRSGCR